MTRSTSIIEVSSIQATRSLASSGTATRLIGTGSSIQSPVGDGQATASAGPAQWLLMASSSSAELFI